MFRNGCGYGYDELGGLIGRQDHGSANQCYSVGAVYYGRRMGGLVGAYYGDDVQACFWDMETSGRAASGQGTGLDTAAMMQAASFVAAGWDFTDTDGDPADWAIVEGNCYPFLPGQFDGTEAFVLDIAAEHGSVQQEPAEATYGPCSLVWLTAQPAPGYAFAGWSGPGFATRPALLTNPLPVVMTRTRNIAPVFLALEGIETIEELQQIGNDPAYPLHRAYFLAQDIDASDTANWNDGEGFAPIGSEYERFTGVFDGRNHVISGLHIDRSEQDAVGLFGYVGSTGAVQGVGVADSVVTGKYYVGALAGWSTGSVTDCYATARVDGSSNVGGLVGRNQFGVVQRCCASNAVTGNNTGGLVGVNTGVIDQCHASAAVTSSGAAGGLAERNEGTIQQSYATGPVRGGYRVGGLVAENYADVSQCYATGAITGTKYAGGFVGVNERGASTDSFWDVESSGETESDGWYRPGHRGNDAGGCVSRYGLGF